MPLRESPALQAEEALIQGLKRHVQPLPGTPHDHDGLLELIGSSHLFEPSGLLYDTDSTLDALVRAVVDTRRPVVLARIPTDSPIAARFHTAARGRGMTFVKPGADTLAVPISSGWNEYLASRSEFSAPGPTKCPRCSTNS